MAYSAAKRRLYHVANWRRDKRAARDRAAKRSAEMKSGPCVDCGSRLPPCAMEFDHLPGTLKIDKLSRLIEVRPLSATSETEKCDLVCVNCHRVRTKARTVRSCRVLGPSRKAREDLVLQLKSNPCSDCGHGFPPEAMDFDHVRDQKLACISVLMRTGSMSRLQTELSKTEVVCAACHVVRTTTRRAA